MICSQLTAVYLSHNFNLMLYAILDLFWILKLSTNKICIKLFFIILTMLLYAWLWLWGLLFNHWIIKWVLIGLRFFLLYIWNWWVTESVLRLRLLDMTVIVYWSIASCRFYYINRAINFICFMLYAIVLTILLIRTVLQNVFERWLTFSQFICICLSLIIFIGTNWPLLLSMY